METSITDAVRRDPVLFRAVEKGNEGLTKALGKAPSPPRAIWRLAQKDHSRPVIELELLYHDESVTKDFVVDELADELELRRRFNRLWDDLLLKANQKSTDRLLDIFREWRREEELQGA